MHRDRACRALARAMLGGQWAREPMLLRMSEAVLASPAELALLLDRVLAVHDETQAPPALATLSALIHHLTWPEEQVSEEEQPPPAGVPLVLAWFLPRAEMRPSRAAAAWPVPEISTAQELAALLALPELTLEGLSGQLHPPAPEALGHYRYLWRRKRSGGLRLLEAPKELLKRTQRRLLSRLLAHIPAHPAAHGFLPGRSARTHAALHTGQERVLRLDLQDFFPSIRAARIHGIYAACGYPEAVARRLTGLCTHSLPGAAWQRLRREAGLGPEAWATGKHYTDRHLPQGAPTSPALANLCAFGLDRRLGALAAAQGMSYSRYADDLAFSGSRRSLRAPERLLELVARIAREEGFRVRAEKTRLMGQGTRQQLTGVVVNQGTHWPRDQYERLKAILHNCARHGPASQARGDLRFQERLRGRIAHLAQLQPERGAKLLAIYRRVIWDQ